MRKIINIILGTLVAFSLNASVANAAAKEVRVAFFLEWATPNQEDKVKKAFDKAMGVPVKWVDFKTGGEMTEAMLGGSIDISYSQGLTPFVNAVNAKAPIKLVDIVPYILSSGGVGGQVQVQREEVGIKLDINPTVNTDGFITVKVEPEVSTIFEFIGPDNNIPRVKSRKSSTTIRVKDGESIIIGGLLSNDRKQTTHKVPVLHKIPWLGKRLFTSKNLVERKTDLIIQITPRIVVDNYTGIMKTDRMRSFEKNLLGESEAGSSLDEKESESEVGDEPTYRGIWNDNTPSALPEQIESDQE